MAVVIASRDLARASRRNEQDDAATTALSRNINAMVESCLFTSASHCRGMRDEEQTPGPEEDGFRTAAIAERLGDLRHNDTLRLLQT